MRTNVRGWRGTHAHYGTGHDCFLSPGVFRCEYGECSNGSANKVELKGPAALRWRLGRTHHGRIGARSPGNPRLTGLPSLCFGGSGARAPLVPRRSQAPAHQSPLTARRIALDAVGDLPALWTDSSRV